MMSNHTPGPWTAERQDSEGGGIYYAIHGAGYVFVTNIDEFDNPEDMVANARLIAAAPELLATLRSIEFINMGNMKDECPCCGETKTDGHRPRGGSPGCALAAAIAKATGTE